MAIERNFSKSHKSYYRRQWPKRKEEGLPVGAIYWVAGSALAGQKFDQKWQCRGSPDTTPSRVRFHSLGLPTMRTLFRLRQQGKTKGMGGWLPAGDGQRWWSTVGGPSLCSVSSLGLSLSSLCSVSARAKGEEDAGGRTVMGGKRRQSLPATLLPHSPPLSFHSLAALSHSEYQNMGGCVWIRVF